jgi:hypothetical protein
MDNPTTLIYPIWERNRFQIIAITTITLLLGLGYLLSPSKDDTAYQDALSSKNIPSMNSYLNAYPNGKYRQAVLDIKDKLAFDSVNYYLDKQQCPEAYSFAQELDKQGKHFKEIEPLLEQCYINKVRHHQQVYYIDELLAKYPNTTYRPTADSLYEVLWKDIYKTYEAKVGNSKAKAFFRTVLDNAKKNRDYRIGITFKPVLALKDWNDYQLQVREAIDREFEAILEKEHIPLLPPSQEKIASIKNAFTTTNQREMQEVIVQSLGDQLEQVFDIRLFNLEIIDLNKVSEAHLPTYINLQYDVKTSSHSIDTFEVPNLYISMQEDRQTKSKMYQGYMLGIGITWKMVMETANQAEKFTLTYGSEAHNYYQQNNNKGKTDNIYNAMIKDNFNNFAIYIGQNFGWFVKKSKDPQTE